MLTRALPLAALLTLVLAATAWAAGVSPARGSTRSGLVSAFVRQDGTSVGIRSVYVSGTNGIVFKRPLTLGLVRFLFRHSGSSHFAFSTRGTHSGSATQRRLECACR